MDDHRLTTPVVLLIFNRPETTARVFAQVAKAEPRQLLVVADGPRADRSDDPAKCAAARAVVEGVNWDCDLKLNYAQENLGLRRRVAGGLDWVFDQVDEAIILEDDCVPDPTFFRFCQELLAKYRNDERIMVVSGNNFQRGRRYSEYSYYFSRYNHCWGWATWRRAWVLYDDKMRDWPGVRRDGQLRGVLEENDAMRYWTRIFDRTYSGEYDSWAYRWTYSCWCQSGLTILPAVNLVSNIGSGPLATHTTRDQSGLALPTIPMEFPLQHPTRLMRQVAADAFSQRHHFRPGIVRRIKQELVRLRRRLP